MASETITQADKDCAQAILEADIAAGGETPFVKTAAHYIAAYRHAAVAELVELLRDLDAWLKGGMNADGKELQARADDVLSRHQAGLGKGEG